MKPDFGHHYSRRIPDFGHPLGALTKLQEAWDSSEQKDECIVCLDDLERAYWMGAEIGQLGGDGFQGVALGVDGSCKDGRMGAGCCKFRKEGEDRQLK